MKASPVFVQIVFTLLAIGVPIVFGIVAWLFFRDSPRYSPGNPSCGPWTYVFPSHYNEKDILCGIVATLCCLASLALFTFPYGIAYGWWEAISPLYS